MCLYRPPPSGAGSRGRAMVISVLNCCWCLGLKTHTPFRDNGSRTFFRVGANDFALSLDRQDYSCLKIFEILSSFFSFFVCFFFFILGCAIIWNTHTHTHTLTLTHTHQNHQESSFTCYCLMLTFIAGLCFRHFVLICWLSILQTPFCILQTFLQLVYCTRTVLDLTTWACLVFKGG